MRSKTILRTNMTTVFSGEWRAETEWTVFATDARGATRNDTWHLPVKGTKANAKARARARATKAPSRHGNIKNLDALTHIACPDTANYAPRVLRTSTLMVRTLESSLRIELHLLSAKLSTKVLIGQMSRRRKQARGRHQKHHSMPRNSNS